MSEKRFKLDFDNCSDGRIMDRKDKYGQYCRLYDFGEVGRQQIVDLLNSLCDENEQLKQENNKFCKDNSDLILINFKQIKERLKLMNENKQLKQENEQLRKQLKQKQEDNVKSVQDEVFTFNTNCAKLYQIRSVSPNGIIRIGSKNHKVKWRMKDVREINNELPPQKEFNREEYNKLRNKYHTKNWYGDDVLGRIIYNIYNGTFGDYL